MTAHGVEILKNPHPGGHIVFSYTDESQVVDAVSLFASAGLRIGEAVVLVVTESHSGPILKRLYKEGFYVEALIRTAQLIYEKAEALLPSLSIDGIINESAFSSKIGGLIAKAKAASGGRSVRVLDEMVSLIWRSNPEAARRLEGLWSRVIQEHSVPLLCAYALAGSKPEAFPRSLLKLHAEQVA